MIASNEFMRHANAAESADILSAFSKGDENAYTVIDDLMREPLHHYLQSYNRRLQEQDREDLVQETLLVVWKKAAQYDVNRGSIQAWAFTIARNKCNDFLRKKIKGNKLSMQMHEEAADFTADPNAKPVTDSIENAERDAALKKALEELEGHKCFSALHLRFSDTGYEEIAAALDIPVGTVKSRLNRGYEEIANKPALRLACA